MQTLEDKARELVALLAAELKRLQSAIADDYRAVGVEAQFTEAQP